MPRTMMVCCSNTVLVRDQILILVWRDFKLKYNSTVLGVLWSFLVPTLQSVLYWLVFRSVAKFGIEKYLLYMLSGMFLWHFFNGCVSISRQCFLGNAALIKKTAVNRSFLVLSRLLTEWLHLVLAVPLLIALMFCYDVTPSYSLLTLPVVLAAVFLFTLGMCFFVATANLYFRDLERILSVIMHALFFATPVFYHLGNANDDFRRYLQYNPLAYYFIAWRNIFYSPAINWQLLAFIVMMGVISASLGYVFYQYREPDFAEKL